MKNLKTLSILNLAGFILVIILNSLANALPINGLTTGELSDMYPNLFVPSGFTFSIWGLIYLLLLVFVIYGLVKAFDKTSSPDWLGKIGPWFFVSCLANASWILAWHYQFVWLSLLIMLTILGSLIMIYQQLGEGQRTAPAIEKFLVWLPFSVYLGWITIATVANVTTLLVDQGVGGLGLGEELWTVIVILVATGISATMLLRRGDLFYSLVTLWAFFGILSKRTAQAQPEQMIVYTLYATMGILVAVAIFSLQRQGLYRARKLPV